MHFGKMSLKFKGFFKNVTYTHHEKRVLSLHQSRATIGPPAKRHLWRFAGGPKLARFNMPTGFILHVSF